MLPSAITLAALTADPYPIFRELRQKEPVAWVPAANRYFVTRYGDVLQVERQPLIFSSDERGSLMLRAIGHSMLRLDGDAHRRIRSVIEPKLKQSAIRERWAHKYQSIVDDKISEVRGRGRMNLVEDFAAPCSAAALAALLGLRDSTDVDLLRWSQGVIDGCSNYGDDPAVWARSERGIAEVDAAIGALIPVLKQAPDDSMLSAFVESDAGFTQDEIRRNVLVTIGGGINEPRDVMATATYALLKSPDQLQAVVKDPSLWNTVFDEALRWVSPVGMYPRQTTQKTELGGVVLEPGAKIGVLVGSANRDETVYENPDRFDINRTKRPHLAFGGGPHYCLGAWAARALVAQAALPALFSRLKNLRLVTSVPVNWSGWVFRGPNNLEVEWDV